MKGRTVVFIISRMFFLMMFGIISTYVAGANQQSEAQHPKLEKEAFVQKAQKLRMPFIANHGQTDERVRFYANTFGGTVFVTKDGEIVYALPGSENKGDRNQEPGVSIQECSGELHSPGVTSNAGYEIHDNHESCIKPCRLGEAERTQQINDLSPPTPKPRITSHTTSLHGVALKETLICANVKEIKGEENAVTKVNYFKGSDPSKWKTGISTCNVVNLGEVYEGIGLRLKAYGNNVEKVFCVKPGADPGQIRIGLSGIKDCGMQNAECGIENPKSETRNPKLQINEDGELVVETELGPVKFTKPVAYQEIDGRRVEVAVEYELYVSPQVIYRKDTKDKKEGIVGGTDKLRLSVLPAKAEELGNVFFPMSGAKWAKKGFPYIVNLQPAITLQCDNMASVNSNPQSKVQDQKFEYGFKIASYDHTKDLIIDPLLASTFLGGSSGDNARSIAIDSDGNIFITGATSSSNFPATVGVYEASKNDTTYDDVFVSKLNNDLSSLISSTFLGGSSSDSGYSLAIDIQGNVIVTGRTTSTDYPTTNNSYDTSYDNGHDVFLSKLSNDLTNLMASTYLGGKSNEYSYSLATDTSGNVYVTGNTNSSDFPIASGAYDISYNGGTYGDVFVSKFNETLTNLLASTYIGGTGDDYSYSIAIDSYDNILLAGNTSSLNYPVTNGAYDTQFDYDGSGGNAFITKMNNTLTDVLASTLFGKEDTYAKSVAFDSDGNVIIAGYCGSRGIPITTGAYDTSHNGSSDVFVSKLDSGLTNLIASTYLGGSAVDEGMSIAIDSNENVYVTGMTKSLDFPSTMEAYDTSYNGENSYNYFGDIFVSKLNGDLTTLIASTFLGGTNNYYTEEYGFSLSLDSKGNVYVTGITYASDFPTTSNAYDTSFNGTSDAFISKLDSHLSASSTMPTPTPSPSPTPSSTLILADEFNYPVGYPDGSGYYVAQDFAEKNSDYDNKYHLGEDWNDNGGGNTDCDDTVYSVANGVIVYAENVGGDWENVIVIRHTLPDGSQVESMYGHLRSMLKTSGNVYAGEEIGTIGDGNGAFYCHLHFEIRYPDCAAWGSHGPGYGTDTTGWTDPSDFINAHRSPTTTPTPTSTEEEDFLEKYAPILYMHHEERFHPTKVEVMIENSELYEKKCKKKKKNGECKKYEGKRVTGNKNKELSPEMLIEKYNDEKYYLKLKGDAVKAIKDDLVYWNWKKDQTVYGRMFTDKETNKTVLQYWFFYVYNDWGGIKELGNRHEGDWEMIQIILDSNKQPSLITYSFHHGGQTFSWNDTEVSKSEDGSRPLVYITLGGHGCWNKPGSHMWYQKPKMCLDCTDETDDKGDVLYPDIMHSSEISEIKASAKKYAYAIEDVTDWTEKNSDWIYWKGYWGEQTSKKMNNKTDYDIYGYNSGPQSPPYIDYIDDEINGRWEKPILWATNPNPSNYEICASSNVKVIAHDIKGNVLNLLDNCSLDKYCGGCATIKILYSERELVFDVYSLDGNEVDLKISSHKKTGESYDVEFDWLEIPKNGKATLMFSPEQNPRFEMEIDHNRDGIFDYRVLPDYVTKGS